MASAARRRLAESAERLRGLHVPGRPLVLPNAWDAASAAAVAAAGFPAVATTSAAVAASLGFADGEAAPVQEMLAAVARIARVVSIPVTVDLEAGYGLEPADLVDALLGAGAVGCNLEDTDHAMGGLVDPDRQAARLAGVRRSAQAAGVPLVVNARVDVFEHDLPEGRRTAEAIERGRRYLGAGADCIYPIMAADESTIAHLVAGIPGPINVYARPGTPSLGRLAALGVARVSFGPWLHRLSMQRVERALERIAAGEDPFEERAADGPPR